MLTPIAQVNDNEQHTKTTYKGEYKPKNVNELVVIQTNPVSNKPLSF